MDTLQQRIKIQMPIVADDDLAIEHELARGELSKRIYEFGKITAQRLSRFGLQHHWLAITKSETAKAIPFRLIEPARTIRNLLDCLGLSRGIGRHDRQLQPGKFAP